MNFFPNRTSNLGLRGKVLLFFFLVLGSALGVIGVFSYQELKNAKLMQVSHVLELEMSEISDKVDSFFSQLPQDLAFLGDFYALDRYLYWSDLKASRQTQRWSSAVADSYRSFMDSHSQYYQIRFLDNQGLEKIKVHRLGGKLEVNSGTEENLQDKSEASYFVQTKNLPRNSVAISEIELSRKHGKIEVPLIPVIRVSRPVVANNGHQYGMIVGNVFGQSVLSLVPGVHESAVGPIRHYLISKSGEYLRHPDTQKEWGGSLNYQGGFAEDFPGLFKQVTTEKSGFIEGEDLLRGFKRIYPNPLEPSDYWVLILEANKTDALAEVKRFLQLFLLLLLLIGIGVFVASRFLIQTKIGPLVLVSEQLQKLGKGEFSDEQIPYAGNDEIKVILDSSQSTIKNLESLASQVDLIAAGNYSVSIEPSSNKDILGMALSSMAVALRSSKQRDENQIWLNRGLGELNRNLQGDIDMDALCEQGLSAVCRQVEAAQGVLYIFDSSQPEPLSLIASYMLSDMKLKTTKLSLGQGTVGQVAADKRPVFLTQDFDEERVVQTGGQTQVPRCLVALPLMYEGQLYGVIEVSSLSLFTEIQQEYLSRASEILGAETYGSVQKTRIAHLLKTSEAANATLESQQELLHTQAASLQKSNAQMEEQQQQLQQQAESLQESNAQMEEQQQQLTQQTELLSQQNQRLTASEDNLKQQAEALSSASRYKSEFLANMSHELRTPLNSIILLAKLIGRSSEGEVNVENSQRSEVIYNAGMELQRLINDILDLAKVESGKVELELSRFDSAEFISELAFYFEHQAEEKGLEIKFIDNLKSMITSDRHKLSQVIRNLLSNSLKFTTEGEITFEISFRVGEPCPLVLSVSDTGLGIEQEKQQLIFDAFAQADGSTSRQYGGTGLGLSISQSFTDLMGGSIEVESIAGKGSTFTVLLPELKIQSEPSSEEGVEPLKLNLPNIESIVEASISDDRHVIDGSKPVVLMIEDDQNFSHLIQLGNQKAGYHTLLAYTGKEGLELAERYQPQGVLLDLGLPDMSGGDVLKQLKTNPATRQIPVYVLSGTSGQEILLEKGALGYLQKPASQATINQALEEILGQAGKQKRILVAEGGMLDPCMFELPLEGIQAEVLTAQGIDEFNRLFGELCPDLLVLPYLLGSFDKEFLIGLRERNAEIPIIILSEEEIEGPELEGLKQCTPHIIISSSKSDERLFKEVKRFLGELPKHEEMLVREDVTHREIPKEQLKGRRILVVDDDARNLFVMTSSLEQEGAKVFTALNGKKGLDFLDRETVDMVLLDLMMPVLNGFETLSALRENPKFGTLPVVILTAKTMEEDKQKCMDLGANEYLTKPVDYDDLIQVVLKWSGQ